MDVPAFDDVGEASHMLRYTGGEPEVRHAILAINLQGGSGFEIWQFTGRKPQRPSFSVAVGDLGIFLARIKSRDIGKTYEHFRSNEVEIISGISEDDV